ncbi:hypothetical protein EDB89DRAFT_1998520 [Lactarius sanguifluus]|nr:hypothetical protein EDB89DRAFT_1998520 [Lactarius sanguifluus]
MLAKLLHVNYRNSPKSELGTDYCALRPATACNAACNTPASGVSFRHFRVGASSHLRAWVVSDAQSCEGLEFPTIEHRPPLYAVQSNLLPTRVRCTVMRGSERDGWPVPPEGSEPFPYPFRSMTKRIAPPPTNYTCSIGTVPNPPKKCWMQTRRSKRCWYVDHVLGGTNPLHTEHQNLQRRLARQGLKSPSGDFIYDYGLYLIQN